VKWGVDRPQLKLGDVMRRVTRAGLVLLVVMGMAVAAAPASAGPYAVDVIRDGGANGKFQSPGGLAVNRRDTTIWVANELANQIGWFDPGGFAYGSVIPLTDATPGPAIDRPIDVAVDGDQDIWFTDLSHQVQVWGLHGSDYVNNLNQASDFDLAIDSDLHGGIYLSTWYPPSTSQVKEYGTDGKFIRQFGSNVLKKAHGVAFGRDGRMYVVDEIANKVVVFGPAGKFLYAFGQAGSGPSQFNAPSGIAIDDRDNLYIAMTGNHRVDKFTKGGKHLASMSVAGVADDRPYTPEGIDIQYNDDVVTSDAAGNRLVLFKTSYPVASFTGPVPKAFHTTHPAFRYHSDHTGTFECQLDGQRWFNCNNSSHSVRVNADQGFHHFRVRAIDLQGVASKPTTAAFHVDTGKPSVTTSATFEVGQSIPLADAVPRVMLSWHGSDKGTKAKQLTYKAEGTNDEGQPFLPFGNFTHTTSQEIGIDPATHPSFRVTVKDPAGNTSRHRFDDFLTLLDTDQYLRDQAGYSGLAEDPNALEGEYSTLSPGHTIEKYWNGKSIAVIAKEQTGPGFGTARICVGWKKPAHCKVVDAGAKNADRTYIYTYNGDGKTGDGVQNLGDNIVYITPLTGQFPVDGFATIR
jgi:sugar lactone lactonase YvrE